MGNTLFEIRTLTGLRGFAALWVVLLHYRYGVLADQYGAWAFFFRRGYLGVHMFFVLSGFILSYVHRRNFITGLDWHAALRFLWLRLARIYPVHIAMLFCVAWVFIPLTVGLQPYDTAFTFLLNVFLIHAWGFTDGVTWNEASWSISTEWFAYLCFPILALVTATLRRRGWALSLLACGILYLASRVLAAKVLPAHELIGFHYGISLFSFTLLFVFGFLLHGLAYTIEKAPRFYNTSVGVAAAATLAIALLPVTYEWFMLPVTFGLMILGLYRANGVTAAIFGNPVSFYLGRISYSLYMTHIAVYWCLDYFMLTPINEVHLLPEICVAIVVASVVHHKIEVPSRRLMREDFMPLAFAYAK